MATQDNDAKPRDASSAAEQAVTNVLRAVLNVDQQALLVAFAAIADPQVRQSLITLARNAAGSAETTHEELSTPPPPPAVQLRTPDGETRQLRRVRRELRARVVKTEFTP
jgi:hypothetical protein